ncbi:TPA: glycosyltransferase [Klebsiella pneumoniae]|uniref:Glycosyl transferase family protein n=1 Tax=Klebsiella sp. 6168 TaxID=1497810 RepID=A0A0P0YR13_9ENTR|nr:glycosyltransferase [Klebsiella pneumoniae]BAT23615.1 glycosyl transferase family protein [Klebsiella sp. 6168]MCD5718980.1 glycosyltransferase [Klebsiella pneumoniae]MCP5600763.1 glycosyltransferase [Klebsiella pneumoniae]STV92897.1 group 1 glycosyl transferase [Klebsiella pneumoniae]HBR2890235.1 glycosyltransferase [Klebsiella pneumoniae]
MIFYCESRIFSGQERMFLTAACSESSKKNSVLIINKKNTGGINFARENGSFIEIYLIDDIKPKLMSLMVWFKWKSIFSLASYLKDNKNISTTICISQGRIESGNIGVLAAKIAGIKVISYIPMVHGHTEMGASLFSAKIKDFLCGILYKLPDGFITISSEVARELRNKTHKNIAVVENFVHQRTISSTQENPPHLDDKDYFKLILPGRLLNKQKGQIDLIRALNLIIPKLECKVLCYIVGEGPDKENIAQEIDKLKLSENVFLLGNRSDLLYIMLNSDLVVLPSHFEGVPLVLLEAALLQRNIIASDIVGYNNYLSKEKLFTHGDYLSIASAILREISSSKDLQIRYEEDLIYLLSRTEITFKNDFSHALEILTTQK